ncbi:MAG: ATP-dependent zinc metalloprotease FtsH [Burkholderiales bacterium]
MMKATKIDIGYVVLAFVVMLVAQQMWRAIPAAEIIPYSEFQSLADGGHIQSIRITDQHISGKYREPRDGKTSFLTNRVDADLAEKLKNSGVEFSGAIESTIIRDLLSWIVPIVVFFAIWFFMIRKFADRMGSGGFLSIGKSRAKVFVETDVKVTFADVAGVDEAKEELIEIVDFLKNSKEYGRLGARIPKGVLLVGPPGTGKTLLARAVAGEAGVRFFSISGSEFVEMFVGVGAARVRDLFEQAKKQAPAIIFIDELDALGRARGASNLMGGHDEREQTLNQLLAELDGFDPREGVVLLAATNRPEILDPALLRAGRFDRQVLVDRPDKRGRVAILKVHARKVTLAPDLDEEKIAALTPGFSGADLANLVNEAALLATRRRGEQVTLDDFTRAIERIVAGLEKKNRLLIPKERKIVAYHEMGHALTALAMPGTDTVHKVSIIPRGIGALGYTIQRPTEDRYLMTERELANKIVVLLGGRAAERLVFNELSTGAADDLAKATDIARSMVARYGMDEELGLVSYDADRATFLGQTESTTYLERRYSEATAARIDHAVKRVIENAFERAAAILAVNRSILDVCAGRLLADETLEEAPLRELSRGLVPEAATRTAIPNLASAT